MTVTYNQIAARSLERIGALSDGLFAIAMTLIVLEIRVPDPGVIHTDGALADALIKLGPRFVTYLMSFLTLGIFWNGQHTQLNYLARANRHLAWLHLAFLAIVALMPFTTSLLSDLFDLRLAFGLYWLNLFMLGVLLYATWLYGSRAGLIKPDTDPGVGIAIKRRIVGYQALYLVGLVLGLVLQTPVGITFLVLVQLNSAIAPRLPILSRF